MRSPADADLVAREPELPGLPTVLDPEAFLDALASLRPDVHFADARVTYLRYEPGVSCLTSFTVQSDGRPIDVYGVAHRRDAVTKLRNAREKGQARGPLGLGRYAIENLALVVAFAPNDRRLRILPAFADPKARRRLLRKILPDDEALWKADLETLRYRPERRYTGRLVRKGRPRAVLKAYGPDDYGIAARGSRAFRTTPPLRVPKRIAKSEGRRLLLFEWMDGRLLEEAIGDPRLDPATFARVGRALARLHRQEAPRSPLRTRDLEASSLMRAAADLGSLWPPAAERAWALAADLGRRILRGPPAVTAIHGDFQAENVLLADDEVRVIDLDEVARGDPAIDVGNFLAHLELDVARGRLDGDRSETFREAFLEAYGMADPARAGHATAAALLRLAMEPFRDREPDWPEPMDAVLSRAEDLVRVPGRLEATP